MQHVETWGDGGREGLLTNMTDKTCTFELLGFENY